MKDGWIKVHRKMIESDIFYWKPPEWLKIWLYILLKVNHSNSKQFPRGTGYFNWSEDRHELKKITRDQWYHCIKWLKTAKQIATQKTTRGIIVKVHNYDQYQANAKQKSEAENETKSEAKAKQKRSKSDTILKECKKNKNERSNILSQIENLKLQFPLEIKSLIEEYIELARAENKTNRILPVKEKRLINELLLMWFECDHELNKKDFEQALKVALNNKAPNPRYVAKVMKSREKNRKLKLEKANKIWK